MDLNPILVLAMESSDSSSSSDGASSTSSSSSSSGGDDSDNPPLEEQIYEEDVLFPLIHILMEGRPHTRVQNFIDVARAKSNEEFREDFRMQRHVAYILLESLEASGLIPTHDFGKEKKPAELCLLLTLWFLANKEPHRTLSNLFGISLSSVFRIIRRVMNWLVTLVPEFIKWPEGNDIIRISRKFEEAAGIRCCIGAIDGSHIYINQPEVGGRQYFNRKQSYSILLQAVADCDMKFTSVCCGDPGSFHDIRMLRRSELFQLAERNRQRIFPDKTFLLGDKGYNGVGKKWIVCPFRDNGRITADQDDFNTRVSVTRVVVERAFGILKGRFRRIQKMELRDVNFMVLIVTACCVLHNICLDNGDDGDDFYDDAIVREWDSSSEDEDDVDNRNDQRQRQFEDRRAQLFTEMYPPVGAQNAVPH